MELIDRGRPLSPIPQLPASRALQRSLSPAFEKSMSLNSPHPSIPPLPKLGRRERRRSITISSEAAGDLAVVPQKSENQALLPMKKTYSYVEKRLANAASPSLLPSRIASPLLKARQHQFPKNELEDIPSLALSEAETPDMWDYWSISQGQSGQPVGSPSWLSRSKIKAFATEMSQNVQNVGKASGNKAVMGLALVGAAAMSGEEGGRSIPINLLKKVTGSSDSD